MFCMYEHCRQKPSCYLRVLDGVLLDLLLDLVLTTVPDLISDIYSF